MQMDNELKILCVDSNNEDNELTVKTGKMLVLLFIFYLFHLLIKYAVIFTLYREHAQSAFVDTSGRCNGRCCTPNMMSLFQMAELRAKRKSEAVSRKEESLKVADTDNITIRCFEKKDQEAVSALFASVNK